MFDFLPVEYYRLVYYIVMCSLCWITAFSYMSSNTCNKLLQKNSCIFPILFALLIAYYLGLRPVSGRYFVDMLMYNHYWNIVDVNTHISYFDWHKEWFFQFLVIYCKKMVRDAHFWFLVVELFYVGAQIWACKKLLFENVWLALLFVLFSSSFFSFGTNGIRNGMACSLMMLSIAFFCDRKKISTAIGLFIFLLAMGCHRSVIVPMVGFLVSRFIIKDLKKALWVWGICIILSVLGGSFFQNLIMGLGFDDRMATYGASDRMSRFSHVGFRWDFLIYSSIPLLLVYYVVKKNIQDRTFNILAGTYIIANSVWVLVCRVAFSNRFAYLSWFMFGLVVAYAIIRLPIWRDQDYKAGLALIGSSIVTVILGNI